MGKLNFLSLKRGFSFFIAKKSQFMQRYFRIIGKTASPIFPANRH